MEVGGPLCTKASMCVHNMDCGCHMEASDLVIPGTLGGAACLIALGLTQHSTVR